MEVTQIIYEDGSIGYTSHPKNFTNDKAASSGGTVSVHAERKVEIKDREDFSQMMSDSRHVKAEFMTKGRVKLRNKTTQELVDEKIISVKEAEKREREERR